MTETSTRPPASFFKEQRQHAQQLRYAGASVEAVNTALKERAEKCGMSWDESYAYVAPSPYVPAGGATSFAAYDDYRRAVEAEAAVNELTWTFHDIMDNIFASQMSLGEKASAVMQAANDLQARLGDVPSDAADDDGREMEMKERHAGILSRILRRSKKEAPAGPALQVPDSPPAGVFRSYKDANGDLRWLAVYSNCFKDKDGETFSYEAHKAYVDYVDATKDFPELWLWHIPGTKSGKADLIDLTDDGFMLAAGVYDEGKKEVAEKLAAMGPLGVSHGFDYPKSRFVNGVYQPGYKTFEISPLPAERAANPITAFVADTEEYMSLSPVKKEFLSELGIDVDAIEKGLSAAASKAKEAGHEITFKELVEAIEAKPAEAAAPAAPAATETKAEEGSKEQAPDLVSAVKEIVGAAMAPVATALTELKDQQQKQAEAIAQLQKSDDQKIAEAISPRARPGGGFVASESKETEADGRGADVKAAKEGLAGVPDHMVEYAALMPGLAQTYAPRGQ